MPSVNPLQTNNFQQTPMLKRAWALLRDGQENIFITGKAGTGKSTLLRRYCEWAVEQGGAPVVVAPTGVAALNVGGQTIHRFFNFYIDVTPQQIIEGKVKPRNPKIFKNLTTLIIDEVSMLRADLMECISVFLEKHGPIPGHPFGGIKMVLIGDLHQLPPVVTRQEKDIFQHHYPSPYFFSAPGFQALDCQIVALDKVYRQEDDDFIALLNRIRANQVAQKDIDTINTRVRPDFSPDNGDNGPPYIHLTTTNKDADQVNDKALHDLSTPLHQSQAKIEGDFTRDYFPTQEVLEFKTGAQIMLLNNDPMRRWVNGSLATILDYDNSDADDPEIRIKLQESGQTARLGRFTWEVFHFHYDEDKKTIQSEPAGSYTQFPFRLAWAVTIHKSQGKTFDRVILDLGRGAFLSGQVYVALSRCTSFEGLILKKPLSRRDIRTDPIIQDLRID